MVTSKKKSVTTVTQAEIRLQAECFQWAWNSYPKLRTLLFAVPNGGFRNKVEASQLKASGVVAGVPDMLFIFDGIVHAFELKTAVGKKSPAQIILHEIWQKNGIPVHIIRSFEEFKIIFTQIIS